jgi:uncharacterized protein YsxB (DUF464 family)
MLLPRHKKEAKMLKVSFEEKDNKLTLKLDGHAGQADIGHDIICSSCSILAYTVAQLVNNAKGMGELKSVPEIKLEVGEGIISCEPTEESYTALKSAYLFAEVGYKLLAHNYPQFVELNPFGTE